jgi:hypothetical protein
LHWQQADVLDYEGRAMCAMTASTRELLLTALSFPLTQLSFLVLVIVALDMLFMILKYNIVEKREQNMTRNEHAF